VDYIGAETCSNKMATGKGVALPEPLHKENAISWLKQYKLCSLANNWDAALTTASTPRAWMICDLLSDAETDTYECLKTAILSRLCPHTEEDKNSRS